MIKSKKSSVCHVHSSICDQCGSKPVICLHRFCTPCKQFSMKCTCGEIVTANTDVLYIVNAEEMNWFESKVDTMALVIYLVMMASHAQKQPLNTHEGIFVKSFLDRILSGNYF
jgi:hypothetical protein